MGIPIGDVNPPSSKPPIVNLTLMTVNVAMFFIGVAAPWLLLSGARSYVDVLYGLGTVPYYIVNGERLYTLVTSMFLHANLVHLLGNMLYLYIFGDNIEHVFGSLKYAAFYLYAGLVAAIVHIASVWVQAGPPSPGSPWLVPAVGASGAISGVLGAYFLLFPWSNVRVMVFWGWLPFILSLPAYVYIAFWFIYQLLMGVFVLAAGVATGVAFWAHIGGFIAGLLMAPILADKRKLEALSIGQRFM